MDPISTLIFNALVRRQSINLPEIGSLKVITRPPVMEKKGMITPPLNLVIYAETENPDFLNIVALIAQNNNQDEIQARAIYDSWLATVRSEEVVRIDSVGEIREKRFYPAPGLNEIMNPIRPEPARVPRQMEVRQIIWWVLGAIIIGGAISYGAITLLNRSTYSYEDEAIEWEELTPATPRTQTATDQPAATTDEAADDSEEATASAPKPTAQPAPATTAPTKPAVSASPATSTVAPGQMGYYVVVGTYSTDANANKFIAQAKQIDNTLSYYKLPLDNGKIMIYTSLAATEQQAKRFKQQCAGSFPDAWIFKRRVR